MPKNTPHTNDLQEISLVHYSEPRNKNVTGVGFYSVNTLKLWKMRLSTATRYPDLVFAPNKIKK